MKVCEACGQVIPPDDPGRWTGDAFLHAAYPDCPKPPAWWDRLGGQLLGAANRGLRVVVDMPRRWGGS